MKLLQQWGTAFVLAAILAAAVQAQAQDRDKPPSAEEVLSAAFQTAAIQKKNVLVHFGASWCTWCKHLDEMLESPEVGKLFHDNYIIAHLTIQESPDKVVLENPGAEALVDSIGAGGAGVPVYIFFDSEGNRLATSLAMPDGGNIGHPVTPEEIRAFDGLLRKTAPRMTAADRKDVGDYLSKQKYSE